MRFSSHFGPVDAQITSTPTAQPPPSPRLRSRAPTVSGRPIARFDAQAFSGALDKNLIVRLRDADLGPGVSQLLAHVRASGFFENRYEGMRRVSDPNSSLEVQLSPNRKAQPGDKKKGGKGPCVLCIPNDSRSRRARWRDYDLLPNKYPYVKAKSEHMLILPTKHQSQSFSSGLLSDMIDYQRAASTEKPVTMHYNGLAGNSQSHLHWQSTHEVLPLQGELQSGRLKTTAIRKSPHGKIESFEQGLYAGYAITGEQKYVTRWASEIVERLDRDPLTSEVGDDGVRRGTYNMLLLPQLDGQVRLIVQPRRAAKLKVKVGSAGKVGVGAFTLGGVFVLVRDQVPKDFFAKVHDSVRPSIVGPSELACTGDLTRLPRASAIQIRTTQK